MAAEHLDVIVVGAGLSGVAQAYYLQTRCPDRRYAILEARGAMGGTWDLFRYPGVRSDSDMHTLGFSFHPWRGDRAIADGGSIRTYIEDTAAAFGIDRHIRYGIRVAAAARSSEAARWTLTATGADGAPLTLTCDFLCLCAGYYDYAGGHAPDFPGQEAFAGRLVHPQAWPADLGHEGKRVVVIGSGATAVTLVPALAETAAHVTMLQRSPSYVVAMPGEDRLANRLRRWLPGRLGDRAARWKNVLIELFFYRLARARPAATKARILAMAQAELGPDYDVATHFGPRYAPWDQRLCLAPDGDLFAALRDGRAEVVTDTIERFTPAGLRLASGRELAADIVVTATGLELALLGGIALSVDGAPVDLSRRLQYKGMMVEGVPNLAYIFGYTNASWTLKAELAARYVCRLLKAMRRRGAFQATPRNRDPAMPVAPFVDLTSTYITRAASRLPKQGARRPWKLNQNYLLDLVALRFGRVDDAIEFAGPAIRRLPVPSDPLYAGPSAIRGRA